MSDRLHLAKILSSSKEGEELDNFIEEDRESGRRLNEDACSENSACNDATSTCNCKDKGYFCDCKPNYEFLKRQRSAGCDSFDSDSDGFIDICEDRSPPRLIVKDSYLFYRDRSMPEKLCYNDYTFKKYDDAEKFLLKQIQASDDCANRKQLSIEIKKIDNDSQCGETTYGKLSHSIIKKSNTIEINSIPSWK